MKQMKKIEGYGQLLTDLKARIQGARTRAFLSVNQEFIKLYWDMGKMIVERQQKHKWGDTVIDRFSQDLRRELRDNTGFSRSNLFRMRMFYLAYQQSGEFVAQVVRQIPWGHNVVILKKVKDQKRAHTI